MYLRDIVMYSLKHHLIGLFDEASMENREHL